MPMQAVEENPS